MRLLNSFFRLFSNKKSVDSNWKSNDLLHKKTKFKTIRNGKITKTELVRRHLIEKEFITSWTAIELYGATRLSAIIFNLRKAGYQIESISNSALDRNKNVCNYTTYQLV